MSKIQINSENMGRPMRRMHHVRRKQPGHLLLYLHRASVAAGFLMFLSAVSVARAESPRAAIGVSLTVQPVCALSLSVSGELAMRCRGESKSGQIGRSVRIVSRDETLRTASSTAPHTDAVGQSLLPLSRITARAHWQTTCSLTEITHTPNHAESAQNSQSRLRIVTVEY